jgi:hypothetical protein
MRVFLALPLLFIAGCDDTPGDGPGMSTNIVDEGQSYDVSRVPPEQDPTLTPVDPVKPDNAAEAQRDDGAQPAKGAIPAALQGKWTGLNDRCGDRSAELELTVTPGSLIFHESVGTVRGVVSGTGGRVRVDAAFTGEGDSWTKQLELRPSANGRELTVINDGTAVTRKRC